MGNELGFCTASIHCQQHNIMLQREKTQLALIAISESHLKNAAMRTVRCRVDHFSTGWTILHRAKRTYKDLNSGGARPGHTWTVSCVRVTPFSIADMTLYSVL